MKVWVHEYTIDYEGIGGYEICESFELAKKHAENDNIIPNKRINTVFGDEIIYETEVES